MNILERLRGFVPSRLRVPATSVFADSTVAHAAWDRQRRRAMRYGIWGAAIGAVGGLVAFAPAAWLAAAVTSNTGERVLLADAKGTVWNGNASVVLTGGPGSRDAAALPGRLHWNVAFKGGAAEVQLKHDCCLNGTLPLRVQPGLGRVTVSVPAMPNAVGQWPAAWLVGLGTPMNTLRPEGAMRLSTPGLKIERVQGRWRLDGQATLDLTDISSRVATVDVLGSYRAVVLGNAAGGDTVTLQLSTIGGPLQLSGNGQWAGAKLRFTGEASAAEGSEAALNNLLNIIGRRQGTRSIISIG